MLLLVMLLYCCSGSSLLGYSSRRAAPPRWRQRSVAAGCGAPRAAATRSIATRPDSHCLTLARAGRNATCRAPERALL
eukprot:scaffold443_cov527-Prasinococcus_capsulatus_cf.AAC.6